MSLATTLGEVLWITGGVLITALIEGGLVYWLSREVRALRRAQEERQRGAEAAAQTLAGAPDFDTPHEPE